MFDTDRTRDATRRVDYSAPALEKGLDVIELLATAPDGLTISEVATSLGLSISQIFRMIVVMERRGWLRKDDSDRYRVSYRVLDLAFRATPAQELARVARPLMYALSRDSGQACHLVVGQGSSGFVIVRQESPDTIGFSLRPGTAVNLFTSSSGHVLLAFAEQEIVEIILAEAPNDIDIEALRKRLQQVRRQGYEVQNSARVKGVRDISYPVFGFGHRLIAALTIPYVTFIDRSDGVELDEARELLRLTTRKISEEMGVVASPNQSYT